MDTDHDRDDHLHHVDRTDRGIATHAGRLHTLIQEELRAAHRVMDAPVIGPLGQQMTLAEAQHHARIRQNTIAMDEARNSLRHRTVPRRAKVLSLLFLGVIDFPIMLWLAGSVFNVDWSAPFGIPLLISVVISLLGTAGSAWVLHHLGHNRREDKTDRRRLDPADLSAGERVSLAAAGVLVVLIAMVMFFRVYTEGVLSGLAGLSILLAALISFIMLLAAALVFSTAFRDGSVEQDDLAHYGALVQAGLERRRAHEDRAAQLRAELTMLLGSMDRGTPPDPDPVVTTAERPVEDVPSIGSADRTPTRPAWPTGQRRGVVSRTTGRTATRRNRRFADPA